MAVRDAGIDPVELVILPPSRDLGDGFMVRRALPQPQRHILAWIEFSGSVKASSAMTPTATSMT